MNKQIVKLGMLGLVAATALHLALMNSNSLTSISRQRNLRFKF